MNMSFASDLAALLRLRGYHAASFNSPVEALAAVARAVIQAEADMLIAEVAMPGPSDPYGEHRWMTKQERELTQSL
jgi:hypothetical protein